METLQSSLGCEPQANQSRSGPVERYAAGEYRAQTLRVDGLELTPDSGYPNQSYFASSATTYTGIVPELRPTQRLRAESAADGAGKQAGSWDSEEPWIVPR